MTTWKDVPGFEGRYLVSDYGAIKNAKTGYFLTVQRRCNGYMTVTINKKLMLVHRVVALAFIPNPENKPYVDHINTVKSDNRVENLRWVTAKENANNKLTREHQKEAIAIYLTEEFRRKQSNAKQYMKKAVKCIETGECWESLSEASKALGIDRAVLGNACRYSVKHTLWRCSHYKGKEIRHYIYVKDEPVLEFANKRIKHNSRQVRCIETGGVWGSVAAAAQELGLSRTYIYNACDRASNKKNTPAKVYAGKPVLHFEYI